MKRVLGALFLILSISTTSGCKFQHSVKSESENIKSENAVGVFLPVSFGEGVWYFDVDRSYFGKSLANFKKVNPDLRVVSIAADDNSGYGSTSGYFVVVEPKTKCTCSE